MFQPHVGNDADDGHDDVRGVEPSAQSGLDDGHFDVALREEVERHGRGHLEERKPQFDHLVVVLVDEVHHLLLGNHLAVDPDALAEIRQMGRGEEPRAVARLLEHRGDDVRDAAFAVGAGHVDVKKLRCGLPMWRQNAAIRSNPGL